MVEVHDLLPALNHDFVCVRPNSFSLRHSLCIFVEHSLVHVVRVYSLDNLVLVL